MKDHILIIEDNPANMELMVYLLQAFGHGTESAFDGIEGVEMAQRLRPHLILCDIHLPKMDGYGVVERLKGDPQTRDIPMIAITALAMVGDRERLLAAGFDGYIAKPIEPKNFIAQIEAYLPAALKTEH